MSTQDASQPPRKPATNNRSLEMHAMLQAVPDFFDIVWAHGVRDVHSFAPMTSYREGEHVSQIFLAILRLTPNQPIRSLLQTDPREALLRLVRTVSLRLLISHWRTRHAQKRDTDKFSRISEFDTDGCIDTIIDCAFKPRGPSKVIDEHLSEAVERAYQERPRDGDFFMLHHLYSRSIEQLAQKFGLSESSVTSKIFQFRERLRELLKKQGFSAKKSTGAN